MITYKDKPDGDIAVLLDGKVIGHIECFQRGYRYVPKAGKKHAGEVFDSVAKVKKSLESD